MQYESGRRWIVRVERGADLYHWLTEFGRREDVQMGRISAIGACTKAAYAIFDQRRGTYADRHERRPLEIVACTGNYSLKDGEPFPHVHIVFAGNDGVCRGGHLVEGTEVFLAEVQVEEYLGEPLERREDGELHLPVWEVGA